MESKAHWWVYFIVQIFAGTIFKMFSIASRCTLGLLLFRLEIKGIENIKGLKGPLIITPNHKSYCDHFFILSAIIQNNRNILPARTLVADRFFKVPFVGWALKNLFGAYPAFVSGCKGLDVSLRNPLRELLKNNIVAIYPEGRVQPEFGIHQIKQGAAYLAQKSAAPILPIAIQGVESLSLKTFLFGRRKIRVSFGRTFYIHTNDNLATASEEIRQRIEELYNEKEDSYRLST